MWVEKETLDEVMDTLAKQGYVYVENLTWVILQPNNKACGPALLRTAGLPPPAAAGCTSCAPAACLAKAFAPVSQGGEAAPTRVARLRRAGRGLAVSVAKPAVRRRPARPAMPTRARLTRQVAHLGSDYLGRSHRTLLIFRRDVKEHPEGRAIELRHQRSPDVDISIGRSGAGTPTPLPLPAVVWLHVASPVPAVL